MDKLNIIITMGGLGSRFRDAGYNVPKYMIEAKGRTLFEWSMDSLVGYNDHVQQYVFVVRREDQAASFIREKSKNFGIADPKIVELDYLTDGQATTALLGMAELEEELPIMIYNIDTYVEPNELKYADIQGDGYIPCFHAEGTHWSFVKLNEFQNVVEVREKQRISDNCTLGAYYFSSGKLYRKIYEEYYNGTIEHELKEKYVAPLYNYMIQKGMTVQMSLVDYDKVHVLGTPEELDAFCNE
jgi:dTDP-glucose pyrophosphorylase